MSSEQGGVQSLISNPIVQIILQIIVACLLLVVQHRMSTTHPNWANWMLVFAWLLLLWTIFQIPAIARQPRIPRALWMFALAGVVGLALYHGLWTLEPTSARDTQRAALLAALHEGENIAHILDAYAVSKDLSHITSIAGIRNQFEDWLRRTSSLLPQQDRRPFLRGDHKFPDINDLTYRPAFEKLGQAELLTWANHSLKVLRDVINRDP